MSKTPIVFSTDEGFAPLAKGLVLSIRERDAGNDYSLNLIDIGCSPSTLEWMTGQGVNISRFDRQRFLGHSGDPAQAYHDAQKCRPFIPEIFPGHDVYLWIDSDIWIQNIESLHMYRDAALANPDKAAISPLIDVSYDYSYENFTEFVNYNKTWMSDVYGETLALTYYSRAILSTGIFAMSRQSPVWGRWAAEIKSIYSRKIKSHVSVHLAEQVAMNYVLYSTSSFVPIEALHNYNCHVGKVKRNGGDAVVTSMYPHRELGVVHLSYSSRKIKDYLEEGLLYRSGAYLDGDERERLAAINHY